MKILKLLENVASSEFKKFFGQEKRRNSAHLSEKDGSPIISEDWQQKLRDSWMNDECLNIPLNLLSTLKAAHRGALRNIEQGRPSKTVAPIDVWLQSDGRLRIIDGHHRYAQAAMNGELTIDVCLLGEGYSDLYVEVTGMNGIYHT